MIPQPSTASVLPLSEIIYRHKSCQIKMAELMPDTCGLLVFSRLNIYYLTGTLANGIFWLPATGDPILFVRKSFERAQLESPLLNIIPYRSYNDIAETLFANNVTTPHTVGCEKSGISWHMAEAFMARMPKLTFTNADTVLQQVRAIKSEYELNLLRSAGHDHYTSMCTTLPKHIHAGMSEWEIGLALWDASFALNHDGIMRMAGMGEEVFLGHISAGTNTLYPSHFNGPLGVKGIHPSTPFLGDRNTLWQPNTLLGIDTNFSREGYNTDKTQIFFSGHERNIPDHVRRAHAVALEVETTIAEQLRPGAIPANLYAQSLAIVEKAGLLDGYMGCSTNKVPFLGHGIGLNIDEWPVIAHKFDAPLQKGMVIALEPKMGLPGLGMVGSENTYEVTTTGGKALTGGPEQIMCIT